MLLRVQVYKHDGNYYDQLFPGCVECWLHYDTNECKFYEFETPVEVKEIAVVNRISPQIKVKECVQGSVSIAPVSRKKVYLYFDRMGGDGLGNPRELPDKYTLTPPSSEDYLYYDIKEAGITAEGFAPFVVKNKKFAMHIS